MAEEAKMVSGTTTPGTSKGEGPAPVPASSLVKGAARGERSEVRPAPPVSAEKLAKLGVADATQQARRISDRDTGAERPRVKERGTPRNQLDPSEGTHEITEAGEEEDLSFLLDEDGDDGLEATQPDAEPVEAEAAPRESGEAEEAEADERSESPGEVEGGEVEASAQTALSPEVAREVAALEALLRGQTKLEESGAVEPESGERSEPAQPEVGAEAQSYEAIQEAAVKKLAAEKYQVSAELGDRLISEPEKVLPEIFARAHVQMVDSLVNAVMERVPGWMESHQRQSVQKSAFDHVFYQHWPDLVGHDDVVGQVGKVYRQLNPEAGAADFIRSVGAMAMVQLGKPIKADPAPVEVVAESGVAEGGNGARQPALRPHRPVSAKGPRNAPSPRKAPQNEFEAMAEEDLYDFGD